MRPWAGTGGGAAHNLFAPRMQLDIRLWINGVWIALAILWVIGASRTKPAARVQTSGSRLLQAGLSSAGFLFLLHPYMRTGPLAWRFLPESSGLSYTGLALTFCGAALALWARILLGRNWSASVTIKQDHEIIRRGPYKLVRHPIYSGFLLSTLGTALAFGELRVLFGIGFVFLGFWLKLRTEETFLAEEFGSPYVQYRQETKALIPFVL